MLDVLIRGGWVADGTGNPRYPSDVAIAGDRIVDVSRLDGATAHRVIDATGKIVCPGFVDAHSHSDWSLFANPTAESTVRQGVTTVAKAVTVRTTRPGEDQRGIGPLPYSDIS